MNLANKQVTHKTFGKGNVIGCDETYIKIDFPLGKKEFIFPDAFEKYLAFTDQKSARFVQKAIQKRKKILAKEKAKKKELMTLQEERRLHLLEQKRLTNRTKAGKIHPRSQSVFWCNTEDKDTVFSRWNIYVGTVQSGRYKGKPRRLARVGKNTACLLTVRDANEEEKARHIIGAFMVKDTFNPRLRGDGYIPAHPEYRLRLSRNESNKMLFWNYYFSRRYPHKTTWNSGRQRYFDNMWMAQILQDIITYKKDTEELSDAKRFFQYFCRMNKIKKDEIPKPHGALLQA